MIAGRVQPSPSASMRNVLYVGTKYCEGEFSENQIRCQQSCAVNSSRWMRGSGAKSPHSNSEGVRESGHRANFHTTASVASFCFSSK